MSFSPPSVGPECPSGEAKGGGSSLVRALDCKLNLSKEKKIPGHQVISLFGCWCPCGLIFDQIHTNEEPSAPGGEGDILSILRDHGPGSQPLPGLQPSPCQKVHQGLYLCLVGRLRAMGTVRVVREFQEVTTMGKRALGVDRGEMGSELRLLLAFPSLEAPSWAPATHSVLQLLCGEENAPSPRWSPGERKKPRQDSGRCLVSGY